MEKKKEVRVLRSGVLVLIVGTNPLPNYVVGKYLKEQGRYDTLVLIYSEKTERQEGTKDYAERIKRLLGVDKFEYLSIEDVGNPKVIRRNLEEGFRDISGEIHLNYTGGTKTMVVQSYNFLREKYRERFESSYLDARTFKLVLDDGTVEPGDGSLREIINVDIDTLLELHLYEKKKIETWSDCEFNKAVDKLKENVIEKGKLDDFLGWIEDPFRVIFKGSGKILEKKNRFIYHIERSDVKGSVKKFNEEKPDFIEKILCAFPQDKRIINDNGTLWKPPDAVTNKQFEGRVKHTVEFLDGKWLEWYVYKELRDNPIIKRLKEGKHFGISLEARRNGRPFELDIFIINGYQLIGISITTAKEMCKLKGFEIIHRVRQIGGDESKAMLVTTMEMGKVNEIQRDLTFTTGTSEEKFLVFGKDELKDIGDKIIKEVFS